MKYLLQAIESRRDCVSLSDAELTRLLTDVQRSRDDRSLLHDSLERLLQDLRAQSHAAAFLARVNKRDAPDYYDIIKNPMDLGLMLKNVKSGKYRSKEAFRRDLDLIWDNCLIYNTEPSHPLRISAELMRKRSHDLLSFIQDSNDIKSVFSEWVATHTNLTPAEAKALQAKDAPPMQIVSQPTRFLTPSASVNEVPIAGPSVTPTKPKRTPAPVGQPVEMRAAFLIGSGSTLGENVSQERQRIEQDTWALRRAMGSDWSEVDRWTQKGKDKVVQPVFESRDDEEEVNQMVTRFSTGQVASIYGDAEDGDEFDEGGPSRYTLPHLPSSLVVRLPTARPKRQHRHHGHRHHSDGGHPYSTLSSQGPRINGHGHSHLNGDSLPSGQSRKRGVDVMKGNIKTLKRMKRTKDKFDFLEHCIEYDQPVPSRLLVDTDEEGEDEGENEDTALPWNTAAKTAINGVRAALSPLHEAVNPDAGMNPLPHQTLTSARRRLRDSVGLMCGNAGFNGAQARARETLTTIAEEYIASLGRTIRLYSDRYGSEMSREEIVLHTLHATGKVGVAEIDKYLNEHIPRYEQRLNNLKTKLEDSWKERISIGEDRLVTEEDARYFGEESDDLLAGNLPSAFEDDFFGFKAMGLEAELGVANLTIPARLLQRRGGARGLGHAQIGKGEEEEKEAFPPPEPFLRLSEAAVPAQIGLLQEFYSTLLHRRGHRGEDHEKEQASHEQGGLNGEDDDEDGEGMLSISDDEQERTSRYRVPPTGKMPKREFWTNISLTRPPKPTPTANKTSTNGSGSGSGGGDGAGGGGKTSSTSNKGGGAAKGGAAASAAGKKKGKK